MESNSSQPFTSVMDSLRPCKLELRVECTGDVRMPATIRVIVEVHATRGSSLTILKNIDELCSSNSLSWNVYYIGQGEAPHDDSKAGPQALQSQEDDSAPHDPDDSPETVIYVGEKHNALSSRNPATEIDMNANTPRPSKIPVRRLGVDGTLDDGDLSESGSMPAKDAASRDPIFDDFELDLPPSPTPSSQDLMPWTSTKDILDREETSPTKRISDGKEQFPSVWGSDLRHKDGNLVLCVSSQSKEGIYGVVVVFEQFFTENEDWFVLNLIDIIPACPNIIGNIIIELPPENDFEHAISGLDDAFESAGALRSSFDPRERPLVLFLIRERKLPIKDTKDTGEPFKAIFNAAGDQENNDTEEPQQTLLADNHGAAAGDQEIGRKEESLTDTDTGKETEEKEESPCKVLYQTANEFRQKMISAMQWVLPTLFLSVCIICTVVGGPPDALATPVDTLRTVGSYANHFGQYLSDLGMLDTSNHSQAATSLSKSDQNEDLDIQENTSPLGIMDEASESEASVDPDSAKCFLPLIGHSERNKWNVCPSGILFEEEMSASEGNQTADFHPLGDGNAKQSSKANSFSISFIAKSVFRHVACSVSEACTMASVSDYKPPTWDIFERYYCGENGDWSPTTIRDKFDYLLGWTPPECREN